MGGRRSDNVVHSIPVHIADVARNPSELIFRGLTVPLTDDPHGFDERVFKICWTRQERDKARIVAVLGQARVFAHFRHVVAVRRRSARKPFEGTIGFVLSGID